MSKSTDRWAEMSKLFQLPDMHIETRETVVAILTLSEQVERIADLAEAVYRELSGFGEAESVEGLVSALCGDLIAANVPGPLRSRATSCRDWADRLRTQGAMVGSDDREAIAVLLGRMAAALDSRAPRDRE